MGSGWFLRSFQERFVMQKLIEALNIYRDAFNKAIEFVELESLREGLKRQVKRADEIATEPRPVIKYRSNARPEEKADQW